MHDDLYLTGLHNEKEMQLMGDDQDNFRKLVASLESVLKKEVDSRNITDQAIINKFILSSEVFSQMAGVMEVTAVKNMLKYAHIHEVGKSRMIYKNGADINRVIVLLEGKLGVVKEQVTHSSKIELPSTPEKKY